MSDTNSSTHSRHGHRMTVAEVPRTCRCGCGTISRSPNSEFAPGHHARAAPRGTHGHLLNLRERQPCKCGCGRVPAKLGSKFCHGHYARTADAPKPPHPRDRGPKKWRVCPVCGSEQLVPASAADRWKACSRVHLAILRHGLPTDDDPRLKIRILAYMRSHSLSLTAFARAADVRYGALAAWFERKSLTTSESMLRSIAQLLHIPPEQAIEEAACATAGGVVYKTAEQRMHDIGVTNAPQFPPQGDKRHRQAVQRRSKKLVGRQRPQEVVARIQQNRIASGAADRATNALAEAARTPAGRARSSLVSFLNSHPAPSNGDLRRAARRVSERLQLCVGDVLELWAPLLKCRGIRRPNGRHGEAQRCRELREVLLSTKRHAGNGRLPHRFWLRAGEQLGLSYEVLRHWCIDHTAVCGALEQALKGRHVRTCVCGCGIPLSSARSRFLHGHNARVAPRNGRRLLRVPETLAS
jgi:hypothetical protein